jgi:hypothetical protein
MKNQPATYPGWRAARLQPSRTRTPQAATASAQTTSPPKAKVGRPKGSRNKLTKSTTELLLRAAAEVGDSITPGEDGKGGVLGFLKVSAVTERRAYLALIGRALPVQVNARVTHKPMMTLDEVAAELKARGLPPQLIEYLRSVDDELGEDDEPDPYDDPIDLQAEPPAKPED